MAARQLETNKQTKQKETLLSNSIFSLAYFAPTMMIMRNGRVV